MGIIVLLIVLSLSPLEYIPAPSFLLCKLVVYIDRRYVSYLSSFIYYARKWFRHLSALIEILTTTLTISAAD